MYDNLNWVEPSRPINKHFAPCNTGAHLKNVVLERYLEAWQHYLQDTRFLI